jgi:homogentisate 1,2-dioxygenase
MSNSTDKQDDIHTENCLSYMTGFGNEFATEVLADSLPKAQNSPQKPPHGLYAEQISGTAFTAPRSANRRTWMYRRLPSVVSGQYTTYAQAQWCPQTPTPPTSPNPLRWMPMPIPEEPTDFIDGVRQIASSGSAGGNSGISTHIYVANQSMQKRAMCCTDSELLFVPQQGKLRCKTELGILTVEPGEVMLIPAGLVFSIELLEGPSRGYLCENFGAHFRLPELGPIGSNGLANSRDFLTPVAAFDARDEPYEIIRKFDGQLWQGKMNHTPFNVVAWHGNLAPCKYDTDKFMTIGSISYDHPDPSIFTVLTSPSDSPGVANCDFAIFPSRWMVAENTFRPPWFHRNVMSEFMGLVKGQHDAKPMSFLPGGVSLHNRMVPHGPDTNAFMSASQANLAPQKLTNTLAFMFESRAMLRPTDQAMRYPWMDTHYDECWQDLPSQFTF